MLRFVYRDRKLLPAPQREELERQDALFSELLLAPFAVRGARRRLVSAAIAHAIAFGTWQSLCADQGLTNDEAVKALVTLVVASDTGPRDTETVEVCALPLRRNEPCRPRFLADLLTVRSRAWSGQQGVCASRP
jgi:hypothetical protein